MFESDCHAIIIIIIIILALVAHPSSPQLYAKMV